MQNVRKTDKKRGFLGRLVYNSLIVSLLTYYSEKLRSAADGSFVSRIFRCSDRADRAASQSMIASAVSSAVSSSTVSSLRQGFASGVESSVIVTFYRRCLRALSNASVRSAGVFLLSAGFYSALAGAVHIFREDAGIRMLPDLIVISLFVLASGIMLISKKTLGAKFCESAFLSFIFFDALGINRMAVRSGDVPVNRFAAAFFGGMAFGIASYFFSALTVTLWLMAAAFCALILYSPESGILSALFLLVLTGDRVISFILVVTFISYFIKLLRGKRNLTFKSEDVIALFAALVFASSFGNESAGRSALTVAVYFAASNLFRSVALLRKSAVCVSLGLGINMLFVTIDNISGLFGTSFRSVFGFAAADLHGADALATALAVVWIICVMQSRSYRMPSSLKVIFFSCAVFNAAFSASDVVITAALAGTFIFFVFRSGRLFNVLFGYAVAVPAVLCLRHVFSGGVTFAPMRLLGADFSGAAFDKLLFGGAFFGESLIARLVEAFGLMGCLLMAIMLFLLLSRALGSASSRADGIRAFCAACAASTVLIFFMGLFETAAKGAWGTLLFWALCGMISASGNALARSETPEDYR